MKMFFSLYGKELKSMRSVFLIIMIAILGVDGFLLTKTNTWGYSFVFYFTFVSAFFVIIWSLMRAFLLIRSEWKEQTMTFLKSLPITGWHILGAKLLATFTEWVALTAIALTVTGLFYAAAPLLGEEYPEIGRLFTVLPLPNILLWIFIMIFTVLFMLAIGGMTVQLGYILGEAVGRFKGLILTVAPILLVYVLIKASEFLDTLLSFMPHFSLETLSFVKVADLTGGGMELPVSMFVIMIFIAVPVFYLTGWILEKKAEA